MAVMKKRKRGCESCSRRSKLIARLSDLLPDLPVDDKSLLFACR
jgi:hypothetical protein